MLTILLPRPRFRVQVQTQHPSFARELALRYDSDLSHLLDSVLRDLALAGHHQTSLWSTDFQWQQSSAVHSLVALRGVCEEHRVVLYHRLRSLSRPSPQSEGVREEIQGHHHRRDVHALMDHAARDAPDPPGQRRPCSVDGAGDDRVDGRFDGHVLHHGIGCIG